MLFFWNYLSQVWGSTFFQHPRSQTSHHDWLLAVVSCFFLPLLLWDSTINVLNQQGKWGDFMNYGLENLMGIQ